MACQFVTEVLCQGRVALSPCGQCIQQEHQSTLTQAHNALHELKPHHSVLIIHCNIRAVFVWLEVAHNEDGVAIAPLDGQAVRVWDASIIQQRCEGVQGHVVGVIASHCIVHKDGVERLQGQVAGTAIGCMGTAASGACLLASPAPHVHTLTTACGPLRAWHGCQIVCAVAYSGYLPHT